MTAEMKRRKEGDRVLALFWDDRELWLPATIRHASHDGTFRVQFDDKWKCGERWLERSGEQLKEIPK